MVYAAIVILAVLVALLVVGIVVSGRDLKMDILNRVRGFSVTDDDENRER